MDFFSTDKDWEYFGKNDPYYGVFSEDKFRQGSIEKNRVDFFESGEHWVDHVWGKIKEIKNPEYKPKRVLDFGCGVGRVLIPFARKGTVATGVDVSDSFLQECSENIKKSGLNDIQLKKSDDRLSQLEHQKFDVIHSCHVFQHIPRKRGLLTYTTLLGMLEAGGVAVLHFPFYRDVSLFRKVINRIRKYLPLVNGIVNKMHGRKFSEPLMQMNCYSLNSLVRIAMANSITSVYCEFDRDNAGHYTVVLYLKK